jgi:hypothetical protein
VTRNLIGNAHQKRGDTSNILVKRRKTIPEDNLIEILLA